MTPHGDDRVTALEYAHHALQGQVGAVAGAVNLVHGAVEAHRRETDARFDEMKNDIGEVHSKLDEILGLLSVPHAKLDEIRGLLSQPEEGA